MEYKNCRLCRTKSGNLIYIYVAGVIQSNTVADVISDILQIDVVMTDKYPPFVCRRCLRRLKEMKAFKDQCKASIEAYDQEFIQREQAVLKLNGPMLDAYDNEQVLGCIGEQPENVNAADHQSTIQSNGYKQEEFILPVSCGPISVKEELGIYSPDAAEQDACDNKQALGCVGEQRENVYAADHQVTIQLNGYKPREEELILPDVIGNNQAIEKKFKKEPVSDEELTEAPKDTSFQNEPDNESVSDHIGEDYDNLKATDHQSILESSINKSHEGLNVPDKIDNFYAVEKTVKEESFSCKRETEMQGETSFEEAQGSGEMPEHVGGRQTILSICGMKLILKSRGDKLREEFRATEGPGQDQMSEDVESGEAVPNSSHGVLVMESSGNKPQKKFMVPMPVLNLILQKAFCPTSAPNAESTTPLTDGRKESGSKRVMRPRKHYHYKFDESDSEDSEAGGTSSEDYIPEDSSSEDNVPEYSSSEEYIPKDLTPKHTTPHKSKHQFPKDAESIPLKSTPKQSESSLSATGEATLKQLESNDFMPPIYALKEKPGSLESTSHQSAVLQTEADKPMPPKCTPNQPKLSESTACQSALQQPMAHAEKPNSEECDTDERISERSKIEEGNKEEDGMRASRKLRKRRREWSRQESKKAHGGANDEEEGIYSCDLCGKTFYSHATILNHWQNVHSPKKPFHCEICGKTFRTRYHLGQHSVMHSDVRPFSCGMCEKSFRFKHHLRNHQQVHARHRKNECLSCEVGFNSMAELEKHKLLHVKAEVWECDECSESFG